MLVMGLLFAFLRGSDLLGYDYPIFAFRRLFGRCGSFAGHLKRYAKVVFASLWAIRR